MEQKEKQHFNKTDRIDIPKTKPLEPYQDEPSEWESLSDEENLFEWYSIGSSDSQIPVGTDYKQWYENAAGNGDPRAMYVLGKMFYKGILKDVNLFQAGIRYSKASAASNPFADYEFAKMCEFGLGMEKDAATAVELYQRAYNAFQEIEAKEANKTIELKLAVLCENDLVNQADADIAKHWWELATVRSDVTPLKSENISELHNENSNSRASIGQKAVTISEKKIPGTSKSGKSQDVSVEYIYLAKDNPWIVNMSSI